MYSSRKICLAVVAIVLAAGGLAGAAEPGSFGYGSVATPAQIAGWDIDVRGEDGAGLPPGKGTVDRGADVYAEQCAACHGTFGEGEGRFPKLVGGVGSLRDERPEPTVGSYWPFAPTLWDYINRAMPMAAPHTLSADDVYALTAYILSLNDLVPPEFVADRNSLPKVKMRNRDNFIWTDPRPDTMAKPCMNACVNAADVRISSTAEGQEPDATHDRTARHDATEIEITETPVTDHSLTKSAKLPAFTLALVIGAFAIHWRRAGAVRRGRRPEARLRSQQGQLPDLPCHQGRQPSRLARAGADRHQEQVPQSRGSRRHHYRRNAAQPADRDAAIRTESDFDRKGNRSGGGFPADAVTCARTL